jgi:hypothetical protein
MQVCVKRVRKGENIDTEERFKCQECRDVQEGLKVVVKEWGEWREKLKEVNVMQKGGVQTERGMRLILERQVGGGGENERGRGKTEESGDRGNEADSRER